MNYSTGNQIPKAANSQKTSRSHFCSKGVADQQLSEAAARRNADSVQEPESRARSPSPGQRSRSRSRSRSADSSSSVSTISTNKSLSRSRTPSADRRDRFLTSEPASRARSRTPPRKRKHRSMSSSHSRTSRSPPRRLPGSHRKSRRHRTISPLDRGRPSSMRRGSHRSRSNSLSMDKSRITRHRRSLDSENEFEGDRRGYGKENRRHGQQEARKPVASRPSDKEPKGPRRDRSLSPFSKRLALTQAMNL